MVGILISGGHFTVRKENESIKDHIDRHDRLVKEKKRGRKN